MGASLDSAVKIQADRQQKNQRVPKPKFRKVDAIPRVEPTKETMQHGEYEKKFVHHDESGTKTEAIKNRRSHIVDKWIEDGGLGFEAGAVTAIRNCEFLFQRALSQKLTASYGEQVSGGISGMDMHEAIDQLEHYSMHIPADYWDIFENVVRFRLPAGVAGSDLANNSAQAIASAKTVVGFVACKIAEENEY